MQTLQNSAVRTAHFDILLFDAFSNHCLANTVEPLRAANTLSRAPLYRWRFLTIDGTAAESSSGMRVEPHGALDGSTGDMLMVMPSYGFRDHSTPVVIRQLRQAAGRYGVLAGLDTGSWLLAQAGLLDGHRATIHWDEFTGFAERFPQVDVQRARFIEDRNRLTCSGAMAAFELIEHLIGQANGRLLAMDVAQLFMVQGSTGAEPRPNRHPKTLADRAHAMMQANLEQPLKISALAEHLGCSQRRLEAVMLAAFGASPQAIYKRSRLNLARKLVIETGQSVSEIAGRSGYENASAMTRAFRSEFGETPQGLRRQ